MNKKEVMDCINDAFSKVSLGSGIGLWEAQAIDDYESEEAQKVKRKIDEKEDWSSISPDQLHKCQSSLSFFDADGMRFHLPAFIIESLKGEVDDPIFHLTHLDDYAKSKLTTLNSKQIKAIKNYLNWCLNNLEYQYEHQMIKRVLNEYWETRI